MEDNLESLLIHKKYYVYALCYPDGRPFYIGKGTGDRIHQHEPRARNNAIGRKSDVIREIWESGGTIKKEILFTSDNENEAYRQEQHFISLYRDHGLTNPKPGPQPKVRPEPFHIWQVKNFPISLQNRLNAEAERRKVYLRDLVIEFLEEGLRQTSPKTPSHL